MNRGVGLKFFLRGLIILMWCGVIFLFLYASQFTALFLPADKTINVLSWAQVLDGEFLTAFEKKTGIKVNITYFEHNEELLLKLRTTPEHGYDLIMPTDYAVELFIKEGLIKKIDRSKLRFWNQLYPALLGHYHDPHNDYTIPIYWTVYGLGIDRDYFGGELPPATWGLVFDEQQVPECVSVIDEARKLVLIAAQYLFGTIEGLQKEQIDQIKQLLINQKKWIEIYADLRLEYLLASKTCPVAIVLGTDLVKVMRRFDNIDFVIPKEGGFVIIDSFAIPAQSTKNELIYQFLNYLYQPEILKQYVDKYEFFPTMHNVEIDDYYENISIPTPELFQKVRFFKNVIPEKILNELWIAVKS